MFKLALFLPLYMFVNSGGCTLCPPNLTPTEAALKEHNGLCYQFVNNEMSWVSARQDCHDKGGYLAEVSDPATQDFLVTSLRSLSWQRHGVWIGATDHDEEGTWIWDTGKPVNYTNWAPGQEGHHKEGWLFGPDREIPPNALEDCAQIRLTDHGLWHDVACDVGGPLSYSYICQFAPGTQPSTPTTTTTTSATSTTPTSTTTTPLPTSTATTTTTRKKTTTHTTRPTRSTTHTPTTRTTSRPTTSTASTTKPTTPTTQTTSTTSTTTTTTTHAPTTTTTTTTSKTKRTIKLTTTTAEKTTTAMPSTSTKKTDITKAAMTTTSTRPSTTTTTETTTTVRTTQRRSPKSTPSTSLSSNQSTATSGPTSTNYTKLFSRSRSSHKSTTSSTVSRPHRTSPEARSTSLTKLAYNSTPLKEISTKPVQATVRPHELPAVAPTKTRTTGTGASGMTQSGYYRKDGGDTSSGIGKGAVVGIVAGAIAGVVVIFVVVVVFYKRRRKMPMRPKFSEQDVAFENYSYGSAVVFRREHNDTVVCQHEYPESHS